ncbi:NAD(P)/FAD-dependent oxidoreductase [Oxalobacteraceae bacterium OTU3CAMAD1]|nr:NAD(P)/FAD-dependent oxidoreductase [Oxalobacteraceae bacterium OTU3CAMAD1]
MSNPEFDIVAMGAGHNSLVAAAYLAKGGKRVLVLESKAWYGGGVSTRELNTPGFWHDEHSSVHIMIQGNPMLRQDELGLLSRFGLKYNYSEVPHATIFDDQSTLITYKDLDRTCAAIARISARDAEAYRTFAKASMRLLPMFMSGLYVPPAPLGGLIAMLDQNDEGREMLNYMQRSCLDIANELFESDKVKIHLLRLVSENLQMPDELGTGMGIFLMPGIIHTYGVSQPEGGSGKLSEALVRCIEHYGSEVRCNSEVTRIVVAGGVAKGVELASGEQILACDGVIGAIHPHRLRQFVTGIKEPILKRAEKVALAPFSLMVSHYDLRQQAKFYAGEEVEKATMLEMVSTSSLADMLDDFDGLRRGRITPRRLIAGGDESYGDPTRVPAGKGMFHGITFAPYDLAEGGAGRWDEIKEKIGDLSLQAYRKFVANLTPENIIARTICSPLDLERGSPNSMVRGDVHGAAPYFYQTLSHRPTPDLGQFGVPGIERLYLVGPFMHPGGGVFGAGRATAIKMFEFLGMDFERLINGADGASRTIVLANGAAPARADTSGMTLYGADNAELMTVSEIRRDGDSLVITGKSFGTMPMVAKLDGAAARSGLKLLGLRTLPFLMSLPFRRRKAAKAPTNNT